MQTSVQHYRTGPGDPAAARRTLGAKAAGHLSTAVGLQDMGSSRFQRQEDRTASTDRERETEHHLSDVEKDLAVKGCWWADVLGVRVAVWLHRPLPPRRRRSCPGQTPGSHGSPSMGTRRHTPTLTPTCQWGGKGQGQTARAAAGSLFHMQRLESLTATRGVRAPGDPESKNEATSTVLAQLGC